jgi:hypothetical protein
MKNLSLLFIAFLLIKFTSIAQVPDTLWTKTFGTGHNDGGRSVQQTLDRGYIVTGETSHYLYGWSYGIILLKTDENGNSPWFQTHYLYQDFYQNGNSVQQTTDLGYIIAGAGEGETSRSSWNPFLVKTDQNGDIEWDKQYNVLGIDVKAYSVQQTLDGGYIFTGCYNCNNGSFLFLLKTDENGDTLWTKTFGGAGDYGNDVQQTTDGGYIIIGSTKSYGAGEDDIWMLKADENGDTLWTKTYGGITSEEGYSVQQTTDGGYIIVGYTDSFGEGEDDVWLIKTGENGDTIWTRTFGGANDEEGFSVWQTTDGGYVITGYTNSFGAGQKDVWLIRTDDNGDTIWTKTLGGIGDDEGKSIEQTSDGGYIISGYTKSFGAGGKDIWLIKLKPDSPSVIQSYNNLIPVNFSISQNYPNPFNPKTKIKYSVPQFSSVVIKVFDILGNEIKTLVNEEKPVGTYEITWYADNLPSGVYFYRIITRDFVQIKKMVLMK